jgi:hypothetical protein
VKNTSKTTIKLATYSRPLFALTLVATGLFNSISPAFANPAPVIKNQATATYEDQDAPGEVINAASNIVEVTVEEVAGITVTQKGFTNEQDVTLNAVTGGSSVYFRFDVKNVGNDDTKIFIPNAATVSEQGTFQKVQYLDGTTWKDVPAQGLTSGNVPKDGIIKVRVLVLVKDAASGDLKVSLGKTQEPNAQNQERTTPGTAEDVYTVDNADGASPNEIMGMPVNGTREAMDTQTVKVGAQPGAFASIKKSADAYNAPDNSITYNLALDVANSAPAGAGNIAAADLTGTNIPGLGNGILVSDAIPLGTKFISATAPTSGAWVPVYQYGNAIGAADAANTATWTTTADPANAANLRRVGFFLQNGRIAKGTSVVGFKLKVAVVNPLVTKQVDNIAQVFGTTPANPSDPQDKTPNASLPIFDESGDSAPNNFNDDGTPGPKGTDGKPVVNPGIVDRTAPANDPRNPNTIGEDTKGDNSGSGPAGEFISTPINPNASLSILNGPKEQPAAVGPNAQGQNDNNSDFTNKSTPVPAGTKPGDKFDPAPTSILNTVQNGTDFPGDIKVVPSNKANEPLPEGTKVTLKKDANDPGVSFTQRNGQLVPDDATKPALVLTQVPGKGDRNYITVVDLPAGTDILKSFPVQLTSFFDTNNNNAPDTAEAKNVTTDRIYTGAIDIRKESRILNGDKQPAAGANGQFSATPKSAQPGQFIEYRIKFSNISMPAPANSGSKGIVADKLEITEDGNLNPNNWGTLTTHDPASATATQGNINFSPVNDNTNVDINKYVHSAGSLAPQATGEFTFRRKVK